MTDGEAGSVPIPGKGYQDLNNALPRRRLEPGPPGEVTVLSSHDEEGKCCHRQREEHERNPLDFRELLLWVVLRSSTQGKAMEKKLDK
jgi:hypothetical protein